MISKYALQNSFFKMCISLYFQDCKVYTFGEALYFEMNYSQLLQSDFSSNREWSSQTLSDSCI